MAVRGAIQVWDANTCQLAQAFTADTNSFAHASISTDGRSMVAKLASPPSAQLWDLPSGRVIHRFEPAGVKFVVDVLLSPDGTRLLTRSSYYRGTDIYETSLWDVGSGRELHRFNEGFHRLFVVGFSPDGETIPVTDGVQPISLWNAKTGELIHQYP
jgi:WD40 repeat protein